ncbi:MAG TPA: glycerophosphodiester phosphodiesterase, partial [Psychrobacter sp.]|nr:glycerophosphodiester phosphodiesterase [Psychrobacter sp.]
MTISNKSALELSKHTLAKVNKIHLALPLTLVTSLLIVGCTTDSRSTLTSKASSSIAQLQSQPQPSSPVAYTYGVRPFYLINDMDEGPLKQELQACRGQLPSKTDFSIAHRGAPLQLPEHTYDSYVASAQMGAGILE